MSDASSRTTVADREAIDLVSHSSLHTERLGERLGVAARAGDVVALWGELGTGKTQLARGIARGLHARSAASSPTFVVINEYEGRLPMYHVDFYRLRPGEVPGTGWEEYLGLGGIVVIEWPDRAGDALPNERLDIHLEHLAETARRIRLIPLGRRAGALVEAAADVAGA